MPRRQRDSWGSLTYDATTRTGRVRYWAEGPDGYKRRSKTYRDISRRELEQKRAALMLEHGDDAPCPTVEAVWRDWYLPAMERRIEVGEVSPRTLTRYRSMWSSHVQPRWGDVPCDQIRPLHVQQWLDTLTRSQATGSIGLMRTMLDYAVRFGMIATNPARERYIMPSTSTIERRDDGIWSLDELGEVWRAVRGSWFEPAFVLAAFGGLRVGESLGVMRSDVEPWERDGSTLALVSVERQVVVVGGLTDALKTRTSRRVVPIPGRAAGYLLSLGDGFLSNDGFGGWRSQRWLNKSWSDAPIPDGLRHPFHNLRNSWQTSMRWVLKLPPYFIEPMMGHVTDGVTGMYYDRPRVEMYADAVLDSYLSVPYDASWDWLDRDN